MSVVYLVTYTTGEYEDRMERDLGAFHSHEEADAYAAAVNADLKALGLHSDERTSDERDYGDLRVDCTGAEVYVGAVPTSPVFVPRAK